MAQPTVRLVEEADGLRAALGPLRRAVLEQLRQAASATEVAEAFGVSRQRVNYHVRALEQAGLVELVEERRRRGCIERIMRATAQAFVVDPEVLGRAASPTARVRARDRFAAEHLMATAASTVRDVGRMVAAAETQDRRLLTFTVEATFRFAQPADVHRFTAAAAEAIARTAEQYTAPGTGRAYRVVLGGYPAPARSTDIQQGGTHREHDSA